MNWGDIQLESIRKMFINTTAISASDLTSMKSDKKYATYIDAMPGAANEGIKILLTRGTPYLVTSSLTTKSNSFPIEGFECYDVREGLDNYLGLDKVYIDGKEFHGYTIRNNRYLYISKDIIGDKTLTVSYKYYPDAITEKTKANEEIDLPIEMLTLLPLYIASELYKDDDISLATMYRNEFETELEALRPQVKEEFVSVNGWL